MEDPESGDPSPRLALPSSTGRSKAIRVVPDEPSNRARVAEAYEAFRAELLAFLVRATRDPGVAEDLAQETFLRLYCESQSGRPPDNTRAWLYRVAGNLAISRGRRVGVARRWLSRATVDDCSVDTPEGSALRTERRRRIDAALDELPGDARIGLLMAARGFTGREIAEALGRSSVATRTMLFRARLRLRRSLELDEAEARSTVA